MGSLDCWLLHSFGNPICSSIRRYIFSEHLHYSNKLVIKSLFYFTNKFFFFNKIIYIKFTQNKYKNKIQISIRNNNIIFPNLQFLRWNANWRNFIRHNKQYPDLAHSLAYNSNMRFALHNL